MHRVKYSCLHPDTSHVGVILSSVITNARANYAGSHNVAATENLEEVKNILGTPGLRAVNNETSPSLYCLLSSQPPT